MNQTDIIKDLKSGRDSAYRYLYDHYYKMLCLVAFEHVHDTFISEMMVNDVIFSIWEYRKSMEIHSSLRNYLIKSVRNRCLNYLAQLDRQHALLYHMSIKKENERVDNENNFDNPLTQLIEKELDKKINDSIDALPEQTRRIFCLSRFNNMKYDEIARETDVSVDVVKYHIKSALVRLRIALKDYLTLFLVFLPISQR